MAIMNSIMKKSKKLAENEYIDPDYYAPSALDPDSEIEDND